MRSALPAWRPGPLHKALLVSAALHGLLLAIHPQGWTLPRSGHVNTMQVVLVNGASRQAPQHAQALAQHDLDGGGDARAGDLATSPLQASALERSGDANRDLQQQLRQQRQRQQQLLGTLHAELRRLQQLQAQSADPQQALALQQRRRRLSRQLGAIERELRRDSAPPRRLWLGPNTRASAFARYDARLRARVEQQGTVHFPQQDGRKLYGQLVMQIVVASSGRLLQTTVLRSSGQPLLDRLACATVAAAQPFGRFDTPMRTEADQLALVAAFDFERGDQLRTHLSTTPHQR